MYSEVESRRFDRRVIRVNVEKIDRAAVQGVRDARPDLAIVRFPSSELSHAHHLGMLGVAPLVADTLVYYGCELEAVVPRALRNTSLTFQRANESHRPQFEELVQLTFKDYRSHYSSNPTIPRAAVLAGYVEWGLSFLEGGEHHVAWLAFEGDRPVAFANCSTRGEAFEGVLFGVHPAFSGRGVYGDLIAYTQAFAKGRGCARMVVSTQIDNFAVQRAWVKQGFSLERSLNTVHLNLFLSDEHVVQAHRERLCLSAGLAEQVERLGGDPGPLHVDEQAARAAGLQGEIVQGAVLNALVSRVVDQRLPGPDTTWLEQHGAYLQPIKVGQEVDVHVLVKLVDTSTGRIVISTRVYDSGGALAFGGQATVLNARYASQHGRA